MTAKSIFLNIGGTCGNVLCGDDWDVLLEEDVAGGLMAMGMGKCAGNG